MNADEMLEKAKAAVARSLSARVDLRPRPPMSVNIKIDMSHGADPDKLRDAFYKMLDEELRSKGIIP